MLVFNSNDNNSQNNKKNNSNCTTCCGITRRHPRKIKHSSRNQWLSCLRYKTCPDVITPYNNVLAPSYAHQSKKLVNAQKIKQATNTSGRWRKVNWRRFKIQQKTYEYQTKINTFAANNKPVLRNGYVKDGEIYSNCPNPLLLTSEDVNNLSNDEIDNYLGREQIKCKSNPPTIPHFHPPSNTPFTPPILPKPNNWPVPIPPITPPSIIPQQQKTADNSNFKLVDGDFPNPTNILYLKYNGKKLKDSNNYSILDFVTGNNGQIIACVGLVYRKFGIWIINNNNARDFLPIYNLKFSSSAWYPRIAMSKTGEYIFTFINSWNYVPGNGYESYFFQSTDYGNSWKKKNINKIINRYDIRINLVAVSDSGQVIIFIYNDNTKVNFHSLVSYDYGKSWKNYPFNISPNQVGDIATSSDCKYVAIVENITLKLPDGYELLKNKIWISNNYGETWSLKGETKAWTSINMDYTGQYLSASYMANSDTNESNLLLYFSNDFGETWQQSNIKSSWEDNRGLGYTSSTRNGEYIFACSPVSNSNVYLLNQYGNNLVCYSNSYFGYLYNFTGRVKYSSYGDYIFLYLTQVNSGNTNIPCIYKWKI